jgi:proteic killer suppression protein
MLHLDRIKHKALREFAQSGQPKGLRADWVPKLKRILDALDVLADPEELRGLPGFGFHELKGNRKGTYSIMVSRNWRVTFKWDASGPVDVDLEDYHD